MHLPNLLKSRAILRIEATNRDRSEQAQLAIRTFELCKALESKMACG
jgi:hypothetical protein